MKCLHDGTLQAYLDRELPENEMRGAGAHVETCAVCRGRLAALEATAQRVHASLDVLTAGELAAPVEAMGPKAAAASPAPWRWIAVAAALVLAASAGLYLAANHRVQPIARKIAASPAVRAVPVRETLSRPVLRPSIRVRKRFPTRHPGAPLAPAPSNGFIALGDSDPMQIGVVVRVKVPVADTWFPGATQEVAADLVIGEDGRARAIRFVR